MLFNLVVPTLGVLLPFLAQQAASFNPSWGYTLFGALGHPHEQMTYQGLTDKYLEYFDIGEFSVTNSMDLARNQIIAGTKIVDKHGDVEAELSEAHCDDESLQLCHERLKSNLTVIRTLLKAGNVGQARDNLGRMLHTLQDFYSHSNWIELGMTDISHNLVQQWPLEKLVDDTKKMPSCINCTYPGTPDFAVDWELRWDDYARTKAVSRPGAITPDPMSAVTKGIIAFLMGLKKFSVSIIKPIAKRYLGAEVPEELIDALAGLGDSLLNVKPDCRANLKAQFTLPASQFLTTGYFGVDIATHSKHTPAGKCSQSRKSLLLINLNYLT